MKTITSANLDDLVRKVKKELVEQNNYPVRYYGLVAQLNSPLDNAWAHFKRDPILWRSARKSKGGLRIIDKIMYGRS